MTEKNFLLVYEGETDIYIFQALAHHFSISIKPLPSPQDATSGTYPSRGYGDVLNWCLANRNKLQMLIDFEGAEALFIQMDTDIANKINPEYIKQNYSARVCCETKLNEKLNTTKEPPRCYYILPTQNTETWILASHHDAELDENQTIIHDYELITDTEQRLIKRGYKSKKGVNNHSPRKLNKKPATKYKTFGEQLVTNLTLARQRCTELNRLCLLFETQSLSNI